MEYTNNDIKFFGRVVSAAKDGIVASAEQVKDYAWGDNGAFQSDINKQLKQLVQQSTGIDPDIVNKVNSIESSVDVIGNRLNNFSMISFDQVTIGSFIAGSSDSESDGKIYLVSGISSQTGTKQAFCKKVGSAYYASGDLIDYNQYDGADPKPRADKLFYCKSNSTVYKYENGIMQSVSIPDEDINKLFNK